MGNVTFKFSGQRISLTKHDTLKFTRHFFNINFIDDIFYYKIDIKSKHYLSFYNCGFVGNTVYCGGSISGLQYDCYYFYNCITNGKTYPTSVPANSSNTLWKNVTSGSGTPAGCTVSNCRTDGVASATGFTVNTNTSIYEPYAQNMMIPDEYQVDAIDSSFHSTLNLTLIT